MSDNTPTSQGRTMRSRQGGQALALFVAPWCFVIANTGDMLTRPGGLNDSTSRGALEISAAHPVADKWLSFAAMLGCLLLIPAVLGAMSLVRVGAARLGVIGGVLMIAGYVCYFGLVFQGFATIALANQGGVTPEDVAVLDLTTNQAFYVVVALTFVLGNLVGTFLIGLALTRSRAVPRWAGLCVIAWPVLHVIGGGWGEVLGAALQAVGLTVAGHRLLISETPEQSETTAGHMGVTPRRTASSQSTSKAP